MSIVESVFPFIHKSKTVLLEQQEKKALNELFGYCIGLVNREDLIRDYIKNFNTFMNKPRAGTVMNIMSTYVSIEQFILGNKPPIVKEEFTRQQLRDAIKQHVRVDDLPPLFRVLFVPNQFQKISIYEIGIKQIMIFF